jgi:hypothetical protein
MPVLDNWDDADAEWDVAIQQLLQPVKIEIKPETPTISTPFVEPQPKHYNNPYTIYPYFMAGVEGTVLKELFPMAEFPIASLKHSLGDSDGLINYVASVRLYINSLFYILKSTKYYNPSTKTRVPPKTKNERIDPNFAYVSLEDQLRVYRLFGFQGHIGQKKADEDNKRDELLGKLKSLLYDKQTLTIFVILLLKRINITTISETEIRSVYDYLRSRPDYENKSFRLSSKWFHDASWQKLRYVYGGSSLDRIGGGDGAITGEMAACIYKQTTFIK